ncbi:MAG TPA: SpoIIE family protein phosphatase [Methylomirabilota bacterium]|jgi:sigma-B regulation protein RsbU (phosphoserine phosphatase)|nr:SpoIIE family protein phosphatase [Methylomirabilota bacterium]
MAPDRLKILLIEHDPRFARTLGEMLGQARDIHAEMRSANNLRAGLSVLADDHFDLVMFDVSVPDGAGLANVSLIRAEAPDLPIIVAGDSDNETFALEAVHAGAHDYLVKSQITPSWLERSIRYAIERHRMDTALLDAEKKYHGVFDHLIEGIFQTSPEGAYLMANAALARIYGYASPEELMRSLTDIGRRLYVDEGRRAEFVRVMQEHDTITGFESQIYRKDNSVIWISENCRAIRDAKGRLLYYEGTVEDITQRREAEEKLRNSETLYHSLVETLPQNIFRKDRQEKFTFGNQQFCKVLGKPLEEIVGKTDFDFFPPELAAKYQSDDRRVMETGQPYSIVEEHRPPGGKKMFVQVVKTPLYGPDGKINGLQGIFWDITEQRLAEEKIRRVNALLAQNRKELRARNRQMQDDLKMAREIQLTMLPQQYPAFPRFGPQTESAFHFTHRYLPTGTVGGDFFTISALSESEAAVFICDVAGHGVRSALVTAMIRALLEELKPVAGSPGEFLTKLNHDLHAILKHTGTPLLTTAFYLVADWRTGVMRYANAGHPKPLLIRRSEHRVEPLVNASGKSQPALGLFEDAVYQKSEVHLSPNDLVMLFTDGLYEVPGAKNDLYTQELLIAGVQQRSQLPASLLFDALLKEIDRFSAGEGFTDDVCLVGIELTPNPEPRL